MIGARLIPAAEVALITLLEVVLGPLGWISINEKPAPSAILGGFVVVFAVAAYDGEGRDSRVGIIRA